jgi:hypothetical protein
MENITEIWFEAGENKILSFWDKYSEVAGFI